MSGVHRGPGFSSEYNAYFAKPTLQVVHCTLYPRIAHSSHSTKVRNATNDPPATSSHRVGPKDPHISRSHVRPTAVPSYQSCYETCFNERWIVYGPASRSSRIIFKSTSEMEQVTAFVTLPTAPLIRL